MFYLLSLSFATIFCMIAHLLIFLYYVFCEPLCNLVQSAIKKLLFLIPPASLGGGGNWQVQWMCANTDRNLATGT